MMADEDDYLSDKFLASLEAQSKSSTFKTYAQRRKDAQKQSEIRNLAGRSKSRKEIEQEALEMLKEGMSTSLFEREKLAAAEGGAGQSKAMKMMRKMGYQPGQALGRTEENSDATDSQTEALPARRVAPIAINLWEGASNYNPVERTDHIISR
jgi:G-patch domain